MLTLADPFTLVSCHFRSSEADPVAVEIGEEKSAELSRKMDEIYLRRTKEEVLIDDLPNKDERIVFCEPSKLQKELYQHIIAQPDFILLAHANAPCDCGVNQKVGSIRPFGIQKFLCHATHNYSLIPCQFSSFSSFSICERWRIESITNARIDPSS